MPSEKSLEPKTEKKRKPAAKKGRPAAPQTGGRQRLKSNERREQLIEAAQRVFVRQGFHGTRVQDLAKEAGINAAVFFMHFQSKQEIYDAAITEPLRTLVKTQLQEGKAFASAPDPKTKEQIGSQAIREIYEAVAEMSPLVVAALFYDRERGQVTYRSDVFPLVKRLRAAAKISFDLKSDDDGEFIALAALGLCFSLHIHNEMLGTKANIPAVTSRISNLLMHGAYGVASKG